MVSVDEFRAAVRTQEPVDVVEAILLPNNPKHVSPEQQDYLKSTIAASYGVDPSDIEIVITGSANLGFSISEKKRNGKLIGARYRLFSAESDVDVAVISPPIFDKIWEELAFISAASTWFPVEHGRLGDYLVSGWLRPDHFPVNRQLRYCQNWFSTFARITSGSKMRRRRVNGGLFYSKFHLTHYMARSVRACARSEDAI